jgi:prepilin-type N-terminal cleavage/methylation domain-containing protein
MKRRGFTLVELAIVLMVVGVLAAGGVKMIDGAIKNNKYSSSKNQIQALIKEIAEYSGRALVLPADDAALVGIVTTPLTDSFDRQILYTADSRLTTLSTPGGICSVDSTNLSVTLADGTEVNDVAFFLVSGSLNKNIQTDRDASPIVLYPEGTLVDDYTADGINSGGYDDITGWMTLNTLKKYAGCEGASMDIIEQKLPTGHVFSTYSADLHPKGGIPTYQWCVTSPDSVIRTNLRYGVQAIKSTCTALNYVTGGTLTINSNATELDAADNYPAVSKITVHLKDSTGYEISKDYTLRIMQEGELALNVSRDIYTPPPPDDDDPEDVPNGDATGFSQFYNTSDGNGNGIGNKDYTMTADELIFRSNSDGDSYTAFYGCESPAFPSLPCPEFGNDAVLSASFIMEYSEKDDWRYPSGVTFAVIRSKYKYSNNTVISTANIKGDTGNGLGYGDRGGYVQGMPGGNSFAIEFDVLNDGEKKDKDGDHIAVVSYASIHDYNGTWANDGSYNNDHTYSTYADNKHETIPQTDWDTQHLTYNEPCTVSGLTGTGCYYSNSEEVIPNNYHITPSKLFGVRVEAVSGCNSDGSECNVFSGADNYICVFMWKEMESDMLADQTLYDNMMDVELHHAYDFIRNGTPIPLGTPLVKDCIPDDTTTRNTLDYIRFGFTSGSEHVANNQYYWAFYDFSIKIKKYLAEE